MIKPNHRAKIEAHTMITIRLLSNARDDVVSMGVDRARLIVAVLTPLMNEHDCFVRSNLY